jgi:hypothetical protein
MVMALIWNTVMLSKATKTRLESNSNRFFVKLEQISPEGGQKMKPTIITNRVMDTSASWS